MATTRPGLPAPGQRRRAAVPVALLTGVAVVTLLGSMDELRRVGPVGPAPMWTVLAGAMATVVVIAGAWATWLARPAAAIGFALAGAAAFAPRWAAGSWTSPRLATVLVAMAPLVIAGIAQAALAWPRTIRTARPVIVVVFGLAAGASAVHAVGYNPFADPGCSRICVDAPPIWDVMTTRSTVAVAGVLALLAAAIGGYVIARRGWSRAPGWVTGTTLVALTALALPPILRWMTWERTRPLAALSLVDVGAVALVGLGIMGSVTAEARTRAAVDRLVDRLSRSVAASGRGPTADGPGGGVAGGTAGGVARGTAGGVEFAVPGEDRWIDAAGRPVSTDPGPRVVLSDETGAVARITVTRSPDEADVRAALSPAALLALRNAQLSAVVRLRVAEVRASQRRLIATANAERRRIERDLHDGAQQRLVAVAVQLRVARAEAGASDVAELAAAEDLVRGALANLRRVAHGLHPRALTDEGLGPALEDLTAAVDMPVVLDLRLRDGDDATVSTEAAAAAYGLVAATLAVVTAPTPATRAHITVAGHGGDLSVRVHIIDPPSLVDMAEALVDASDRIGAAGGHLGTTTAEDQLIVTAEIPCGS